MDIILSVNKLFFVREKVLFAFQTNHEFFLVLLASNVASFRRTIFDRQFSASVGNTTSYQVLQHSG